MNDANESPKRAARVAGVLYFIVFVAIFALLTRSSVILDGDAAETAQRLLAEELNYRLAAVADLISAAAYIGVTAILYVLLKPAGRTLSLLATFFGVAGSAVMGANVLNHLMPLVYLGDAEYLNAFDAAQRAALARVALSAHGLGFTIAGVFFAVHLFCLGVLILRSTFLPRVLGMFLVVGAPAYLANDAVTFLAPSFADALYPYILLPGFVAEAVLTLWLALFGVNAAKWRERADAGRARAGVAS